MAADSGLEGLAVLGEAECLSLLVGGCVGRVGLVADGRPHILPVNYAADADGVVVFRTSPGSILVRVAAQPVAFEVDGLNPANRTGWSVCVDGHGRELTGGADPTAQRLRELAVLTWAPGGRDRWFAIMPDTITGRRIPVDATAAGFGGWFPGIVS